MEASTASPAAGAAGAIVAALARAGTRLVFGVPGGGPNLDVVPPRLKAPVEQFALGHGGRLLSVVLADLCEAAAGADGGPVIV